MPPASSDRGLLRLITCGSVDDGKSTLMGRLLHDAGGVPRDQIATLTADSRRAGGGGALDFSLLFDGLEAEREQGITIDVAYRYFATPRRSFIVADAPGHEQYTRNMVTGASRADLAIVLVDATRGVLAQTRRHACLIGLLGVRQVVLAVTKMDVVGWDRRRFEEIETDFRAFAAQLDLGAVTAIPVSGIDGGNVVAPSRSAGWYAGPTLLAHLEAVDVGHEPMATEPFRMPVQIVNRSDTGDRAHAGLIASGTIRPGDAILCQPSGRETTVRRVTTFDGDLAYATAGQSISLVFDDEIDCSRGDTLSDAKAPAEVADQFETTVFWMSDQPLIVGRQYWLKIGTDLIPAQVTEIKHRLNVDTLERLASKTLELNAIGVCNLSLDRAVAFAPYGENRDLGGFILIDRMTNATVGAGVVHFALNRASTVQWQPMAVSGASRAAALGQKPAILWFTGLSGSGKSTLANRLESHLQAEGRHTYLLDGDNIRHGLSRDLGFSEADRVENIRRVAEVASLMADAGLIVLISLISPFRSERQLARDRAGEVTFLEIFVDAPLAVAEARDPKGLYRRARSGEIANFTGVDSPYEPPEAPDMRIQTASEALDLAVDRIIARLRADGVIG